LFSGHKEYSGKGKILKILKGNAEAKKIAAGEEATIILDKTPFYGESGGQIGDTGEIVKGKNIFTVLDTKMAGSVILQIGKVKSGNFKKSDLVAANVNVERRLSIARNHTATHLLQAALRKVLGAHVQQQGSLVAEDRLRFDFTHFKGLSKEEKNRVEEIVNDSIIKNYKVEKKEMTLAQAKKSGALAFFGEKYESKVRVLSIGELSKELCGGTHLDSTGQIGLFKILQEGSVASGVRRIEATTGAFAYKKIKEEEAMIDEVSSLLDVPEDKVAQELEKRARRLKELEKALSAKMMDNIKDSLENLIKGAEEIKGMKVITKTFDNMDMDLLRKNVDLIKEKTANAIIVLGSNNQGRALLVLGVTQDLCQKGLDASKLIRQIGTIVGGSGGGRADFAQAGGNKPENFEQAFKELRNIL
jgi:alanyl-tRNA synthetase